jgi:hypothetical protein
MQRGTNLVCHCSGGLSEPERASFAIKKETSGCEALTIFGSSQGQEYLSQIGDHAKSREMYDWPLRISG